MEKFIQGFEKGFGCRGKYRQFYTTGKQLEEILIRDIIELKNKESWRRQRNLKRIWKR